VAQPAEATANNTTQVPKQAFISASRESILNPLKCTLSTLADGRPFRGRRPKRGPGRRPKRSVQFGYLQNWLGR